MSLLNFRNTLAYLRGEPGTKGPRKALRLPVKIPALYTFPGSQRDYHECLVTNVSRDGIGVEIGDVTPFVRERFLNRNQPMAFRIELPSRAQPIPVTALIRWIQHDESRPDAPFGVGLEYQNLPIADRVDILAYGIGLVRKKQLSAALLVLLPVVLAVSLVWGLSSAFSQQRLRGELELSEAASGRLKSEIDRYRGVLDGMKSALARNYDSIDEQNRVLEQQKRLIAGKNSLLREQTDRLDRDRRTLEDRERRMRELDDLIRKKTDFLNTLEYMVDEIGEEFHMDTSERLVILDGKFAEGQAAMKANDFAAAAAAYKILTVRYPGSLLGLRLLFRAYFLAGDEIRAEDAFQEYVRRSRKVLTAPVKQRG